MNRKFAKTLSFFITIIFIASFVGGLVPQNIIADTGTLITSVAVSVKAPLIEEGCYVENFEVTPSIADSVTAVSADWYDATEKRIVDDYDDFISDHKYCLCVEIKPNAGYAFEFDNDGNYAGTATCNGTKVSVANRSSNDSGSLYLMSAEFTPDFTYLPLVGVKGRLPSPDCTGSTSQLTFSFSTMANPYDYTLSEKVWYDVTDDKPLSQDDYFIDGHDYVLQVHLVPENRYSFTFDNSGNFVGNITCLGEAPAVARRAEDGSKALYIESVVFTAHMTPVNTINIINIPQVYAGDIVSTENIKIETDPVLARADSNTRWYDVTADKTLSSGEVFIEGHEYVLRVELCHMPGYYYEYDESFNFLGEAFFDGEKAALAIDRTQANFGWLNGSLALESAPITAMRATPITEVDVAFDDIPADGRPCTGPEVTITTNPANTSVLSTTYTNASVYWVSSDDVELDEDDTFEYGESYYLVTALEPKDGYTFEVEQYSYLYTGTATVNGEPALIAGRDYSFGHLLLIYSNPIKALHAVNVEIEGGDSTCSASASVTAADTGDLVTLTATAGEEYVFVGFDCSEVDASSGEFNMPDSSVTVKAVFEKVTYDFSDSNIKSWETGSCELLNYTIHRNINDSTTFSLFSDIKIDGSVVDDNFYIATSGSLNLSIQPEYLNTLAAGIHTLEVFFADGSVSIEFEIEAKAPTGVDGFVDRCYTVILGREPEEAGMQNWMNALNNKTNCGAQVAYGFIFSQEYINKNKSDEEFVTDLYLMFFGREPDTAGLNNWLNQLNAKVMTKEQVFAAFAKSAEYKNICSDYGILQGCYIPGYSTASQTQVNLFVYRLYNTCLGRNADIGGLENWSRNILAGNTSGYSAALGFFTSAEYQNLNKSNEEFIKDLYLVMMDRTADSSGLQNWVNQLTVYTKEEVIKLFCKSTEYRNICARYGINVGV